MGAQKEVNYYTILNTSMDSSLDEIKKSYHKLALQYHPDKNDTLQSSEMFQRIEEAWRILSNSDLKKEYDTQLRQSELEDMSILIYSRINHNELNPCQDDKDLLKYTCRCGGNYLVHKSDLEETNCLLHVPCQECTFVIEIKT